jgi:hypothetical protein
MKRITFYFVLLSMLSIVCHAQKNLKPATLVMADNQTLSGWVDDREWFSNPSAIAFKPNGATSFKKYTAQEVLSVAIDNGDRFVSRTVTIDQTNDRQLEVNERLDSSYLSYKTVTLFLKVELESDKVNLYSVTDRKLHLFVEKPGGPTQELLHRKYMLRRNGNMYEDEDKTFIQQLIQLMADCPGVAARQLDTEFKLAAIRRQLSKYIDCRQGKLAYQKKQSKGKLGLGVLVGVAPQSFRFTGTAPINTSTLYNQTFNSQLAVLAGLRAQYQIPGKQQRLSVIGDFYYTSYKGDAENLIGFTTPTFVTTRKVVVDFAMLRADLLFRYALVSKPTFKAFINAGINFNKPINDKSVSTDTEVFNSTVTITSKNFIATSGGLRPLVMQPTGGFGASYGRFGLEYRIYKTSRFAKGLFYPVNHTAHQLIFCYLFK